MSRRHGVLCFCRSWQNPLLWSHYADKHRGIALGFEVRDDLLRQVDYVHTRPRFKEVNERTMQKLLFTKFTDWRYEGEWRIYTRLKERDSKTHLFFAEFSDDLVLREVIVGPLCETTKATIERTVRKFAQQVRLIKSRLAFKSFRIVKNQRGF